MPFSHSCFLFYPFPLMSFSPFLCTHFFCFCALSPQCMVQQCHLWCVERHFTLPHLPIWICLTMYVCLCVTTHLGLCMCVCLCQNQVDLFSLSFRASRFPLLPSSNLSELHQCRTFLVLLRTFFSPVLSLLL